MFTLYSGMAIKCRSIGPGEKNLVSVVLPGDTVGLDFLYGGAASSTVQAVTDVTFREFDPKRWPELMRLPTLAERICENLVRDQRDWRIGWQWSAHALTKERWPVSW